MENFKEYIKSGILELYILGETTDEESKEVERMANAHKEIREELDTIRRGIEAYAVSHSVTAPQKLKSLILGQAEYSKKIRQSENAQLPPLLTSSSSLSEFAWWLQQEEEIASTTFTNLHSTIIGETPEVITTIVRVKELVPEEIHDSTYERLLIAEGSCNIIMEGKTYSLVPGDYFSIPLHTPHRVEVTSAIPCKAILQKVCI